MHIVWLDQLIRPVNNPISIFLINLHIILYHAFSSNIYGYLKYRQYQ